MAAAGVIAQLPKQIDLGVGQVRRYSKVGGAFLSKAGIVRLEMEGDVLKIVGLRSGKVSMMIVGNFYTGKAAPTKAIPITVR